MKYKCLAIIVLVVVDVSRRCRTTEWTKCEDCSSINGLLCRNYVTVTAI